MQLTVRRQKLKPNKLPACLKTHKALALEELHEVDCELLGSNRERVQFTQCVVLNVFIKNKRSHPNQNEPFKRINFRYGLPQTPQTQH